MALFILSFHLPKITKFFLWNSIGFSLQLVPFIARTEELYLVGIYLNINGIWVRNFLHDTIKQRVTICFKMYVYFILTHLVSKQLV